MADGYCPCLSLCFNNLETKHVIKSLTTDIAVTSKVFIDKSINILGVSNKGNGTSISLSTLNIRCMEIILSQLESTGV